MSRPRKLALVVAVSLATIGGAMSIGGLSPAWGDGGAMERLSDMEVITAVDQAAAAGDERRAGEAVNELLDRWASADRAVLAKAAADPSREMATRGLMIDMLAGNGDQRPLTSEARALLAKPDLEPELKARVIATFDFAPGDADLLADFANRPDLVGFQALKKLTDVDAARADREARKVLAGKQQASDLQLSAALKARVRAGSLKKDPVARAEFVEQAVGVARNRAASNETRDAAVFAVAELRSIDSITALIKAGLEDPVMVAGAIDQNYDILAASLAGKPTEAQVATVVTAMELHPVKDLAAPLQRARTTVTDTTLQARIDKVVQRLKTEGVQGNTKWTEN